jgi:uncharacterized tellurite resistance protein B-like protein
MDELPRVYLSYQKQPRNEAVMSIASFKCILKRFQGSELGEEEHSELFKEVLVMTLSRASSSDANIDPAEISTIQKVIKQVIGEDMGEADIRVASNSALYESAPLEKYLSRCGRRLEDSQRALTLRSLADVIKSDCRISYREVEFFDMVAEALAVKPSALVGLEETS